MGTELLWKSGPNCVSRILLEMSGKALWPATANLHRLVRLAFSFYRWANGDAEQQSQRKSVSELSKAESEYTPSAPSLVRLASSSPHTPKWQEICFVPYRKGKRLVSGGGGSWVVWYSWKQDESQVGGWGEVASGNTTLQNLAIFLVISTRFWDE